MEPISRKEIVQLNGLTILVGMAIVANLLVVGFMYRWHSHQLFKQNKIHNFAYTALVKIEHDLKNEVVDLEGVSTWNDTAYVRALGKSITIP